MGDLTPLDRIKLRANEVKALLAGHGLLRPVSYTHLDVYKRQGQDGR